MSLPLIPERSCSGCTLCCKLLGIQVLQKLPGILCSHCLPNKGCGIYAQRPSDCATFHCSWRTWRNLGDHWFPAHSHLMVILAPDDSRLLIKVDAAWPEAWKVQPFYDEIKAMAKKMVPGGYQVAVQVGDSFTFVLPDREVEMGAIAADERVVFSRRATPAGPQFDIRKIKA
ncbi:hypothetical protein ABI_17900 [Asticcacaulis biprosthecium C19]|uniref:Uncharacterized protein n=1 Tax=Asticcacaulis biprosthecium C19 TaxID=715226 RepID=F4QKP8_9CAUL|nr:hypothetical protein [Asticcacaulis biprosthecium]EGF93350.1 hypothetical protein ABI_17900 [Asticcacaulis biprosthecium C19]